MPIAFFDLDKTILSENSAKLWLHSQWKKRNITFWQMAIAGYWLTRYHLGFTKIDDAIATGLNLMAGQSEQFVSQKALEFFESSIKRCYRPGAIKAIATHREMGQTVSLLTSNFDGFSNLIKEDLELDYCLSTLLEVDDNRIYTGRTIGPPCYGENKIYHAQKLCDQLNVSLADCTFYTDSASDVPLLNLVKRAVAVNPDPHLRARAQLYGWEVVNWGKP